MKLRLGLILGGSILLLALPATALAAGAEGSTWGWLEPIGRWFNLAVLVGGLTYMLRAPATKFFEERRQGIKTQMQKADQARLEAEQKLAQVEGRMKNLDSELADLQRLAEEQARTEREAIISQAENEAERIIAMARREIDGLSRAAQKDLNAHAAQLAVELAEERLRKDIGPGEQSQIVDRFFSDLTSQS